MILNLKNNLFKNPERQVSARQRDITSKLLKSAKKLIRALNEESELIKSGKFLHLTNHLQNKIECSESFNALQEDLGDYCINNKLDKNDPNIQALEQEMENLEKANKYNDLLIKIAMQTSERLIENYKSLQKSRASMTSGYNKDGKFLEINSKSSNMATSLNNRI